MLTAHRENDQSTVNSFPPSKPTTRSLDRVVNSIDGLRARVQGFSVEQLSEVHQSLQGISARLAELQKTLQAIREIKNQLERLRIKVQRAEAESLQQNSIAALDRPVSVHSVTQVGTLLKFQRIIKLLKGANNIPIRLGSVDSDSSSSSIFSMPTGIAPQKLNKAYETEECFAQLAAIETESQEGSASEHPEVAESKTSDDSDLLFRPALSEISSLEPALANLEQAFVHPTNVQKPPAEYKTPNRIVAEDPEPKTNETKISADSETLLDTTPEQPDFEANETFPNDSDDTAFLYSNRASVHALKINAEFPDTSDRHGDSYAVTSDAHTEARTDIQNAPEVDFDQRLLDDLIKNYGEFNLQRNSAGPENGPEALGPSSTSMLRGDSKAIPNPASQRNLPAQRKDGELDLKLKKLIKDYGEYDLYSRQSPINLKTGVLAAFLILALAFSGFYFFSSRTSGRPSHGPSLQRNTAEDTTSEKISKKGNAEIRDDTSPPSVSNTDVPTITEMERSRNPMNLGAPKKNR